jgi:hypothetical protein
MISKIKISGIFIIFTSLIIISLTCKKIGEGSTGPCVHSYLEPSFNIDWVKDAKTGNYLNAIKITEVVYNNKTKLDLYFLKITSKNVVYSDSMLICNLPCGFGTNEGNYSLKVSANGYKDTVIQSVARYSIQKSGCPSSSSGGARITFQMVPK